MKKDKLQERRLYSFGYSYDGVGFEYIVIGEEKFNHMLAKIKAVHVFRKKYPDDTIHIADIVDR